MSDSATPWTAARQAPLSSTVSWSLLRFMSIELLMLCNHFILCLPCSFCLQFSQNQIPMSQVFASVKVLSFSFNISTSNEYSGLISFRIDWFDLLAVQGTQESSPAQFKSISSSVLSLLNEPTLTLVHRL